MRLAQIASSSLGMPMKLPITRETTTGWATSVTRSHVSRPSRPSSTSSVISRIASSCAAIRLGVKPAWKSALSAVVLRRVHPDEHRPHQLDREDLAGHGGDAAELGGIGLPVEADLWTSSARVTDQKPAWFGNSVEALGEVHRALVERSSLEQLVRRAVSQRCAR